MAPEPALVAIVFPANIAQKGPVSLVLILMVNQQAFVLERFVALFASVLRLKV